jgi:hypothetical protein
MSKKNKTEKAIPLSKMKPNSDMMEAGFDTSKEYMTKKEIESDKKKKEEMK